MLKGMFSAVGQATAWLLFRAFLGLWLLASGSVVLGLHVIALALLGERPDSLALKNGAEFGPTQLAFYALACCVFVNWLSLWSQSERLHSGLVFAPAVLIALSVFVPFGAAFGAHAIWQISPGGLLVVFVLGSLLGSLVSHIAIRIFLSVRRQRVAPPRGRLIALTYGEERHV